MATFQHALQRSSLARISDVELDIVACCGKRSGEKEKEKVPLAQQLLVLAHAASGARVSAHSSRWWRGKKGVCCACCVCARVCARQRSLKPQRAAGGGASQA